MKRMMVWLRMAGTVWMLVMFLTACGGGGGGGGGTSTPTAQPASALVPVTSFSVDPSSGTAVAPATVTLTDTSTNSPTRCDTDNGDGTTGTGLVSTHMYSAAGTYIIKRTAWNAAGVGNTAQFVFVVTASTPVVQPPVANFTYVVNGLTVTFTYTGSSDATGWYWTFGNNTTSLNKNPSCTYASAGSFPVTLVATGAGGPSIAKTIMVTVTVLPVARLSFSPITVESDYTTKTNVLINRAYVDLHPELMDEVLVRRMFDDINAVIMKDDGNKKRFVLGRLIVYEDSDFNHTVDNVTFNPTYYDDNHFVSNPNFGGSNLILWFYTGVGQLTMDVIPKYFYDKRGSNGYTSTGFAGSTTVNGKVYNTAHIAGRGLEDTLLVMRDLPLAYVNGFTDHNASISTVLHELVGHGGAQIGSPEWYMLNFADNSGTLQNLGTYDFKALNKEDPMTCADINKYNVQQNKFSQLHYFFIKNNATRQFDMSQIYNAIKSMTVKIKVVDVAGNPIAGATVTSFGGVNASSIARNMVDLLETKTTDAAGLATLTNDFNAAWFTKGVKASFGTQYGGAVITSVDLQQSYWLQQLDEHMVVITVRPM